MLPLKKTVTKCTKNATSNETVSVTTNGPHIKTKEKRFIFPLYPPQGETGFGNDLQEAFEAWLAYKVEKRQGYKPMGLNSLVTSIRNNAQQYGEAAVANLIRESMANNWQGIIFQRLKQNPATETPDTPKPRQFDSETGAWR